MSADRENRRTLTAREATAFFKVFRSPSAYLSTIGLFWDGTTSNGEERIGRAQWATLIAGASVSYILTLARVAIAQNDLLLAASLVDALDRIPKALRPDGMSTDAFALIFINEEWSDAAAAKAAKTE